MKHAIQVATAVVAAICFLGGITHAQTTSGQSKKKKPAEATTSKPIVLAVVPWSNIDTSDSDRQTAKTFAEQLSIKLSKEKGMTALPDSSIQAATSSLTIKGFMTKLEELRTISKSLPPECNVIVIVTIRNGPNGFNPTYTIARREDFEGIAIQPKLPPRKTPDVTKPDISGLKDFIETVADKQSKSGIGTVPLLQERPL